eukprot:1393422-Amorphochlora_amoeboformis.AAC.1
MVWWVLGGLADGEIALSGGLAAIDGTGGGRGGVWSHTVGGRRRLSGTAEDFHILDVNHAPATGQSGWRETG